MIYEKWQTKLQSPFNKIAITQPNIILKNVSVKRTNRLLLDGISFNLKQREHLAIFGKSGSGKTLLGKTLTGEIFYNGTIEFYKNGKAFVPKVALVPATATLKNLSNLSNFYYQQRFNSMDAEDSLTLKEELLQKGNSRDIDLWLKKFDLTHRAHAPVIQLSNGELKKKQIIGYLLQNPDVLILDNVFTGLDAASRKTLHRVLNELANSGTTLVLITNTHELPHCITHFAELNEGQLINFAPVDNLGYLHVSQEEAVSGRLPELESRYHVGPLIEMKGVHVKYGEKQILKNIHWQVKPGECWQIKGHNGAGKSTLLSLITADNPQAYSQPLFLFGRKRGSGESIWDIKRKIGFVSPELHNFFDKRSTVYQAIGSGFFDTVGLYRPLHGDQRRAVEEWIEYFSLTAVAHQPLYTLSASKQKLVLIARALVKSPLLLALDEPCQGLDDYQTRRIVSLLDRIYKQTGISILYINHYDSDVPGCIKNVLELTQGTARIYKKQTTNTRILQPA